MFTSIQLKTPDSGLRDKTERSSLMNFIILFYQAEKKFLKIF